jgi:UDP-N-acetylmuramoyl-L-alanyl-D-glutamate--2,6-diaminopimelate ligase
MTELAQLLDATPGGRPDATPAEETAAAGVTVSGVSLTSATVRPGDLFVAAPGARRHGIEFAADAVRAGARAVLTDPTGRDRLPRSGAPVLVVDEPRRAAATAAARIYGEPSRGLDVVGITGTSGKTTTSFLLRAALAAGGRAAGLIGTVGVFVGDRPVPSSLTTPEAPDLQALLAVMVDARQDSAVMEVSSHALALRRVDGIQFAAAAFTNLSQDHLDFHDSLEDYFEAKALLFDGRARRHFVVVDDEWGQELGRRLTGRSPDTVVTVATNGSDAATWSVPEIEVRADGSTEFVAVGPAAGNGDPRALHRVQMTCRIPGTYNVANAVLALAIAVELGVPPDLAAAAIGQAQVPGRMERVDAGQRFLAVVDYSHKPAAVDGALRALRPLTAGRLIIALGCGGDRDRAKRPLMGQVAARGADVLIVTDDNPRSEDPGAIRAEMLAGARAADGGADIVEVGDRAEAIRTAVSLAGPGDTVLVAGKGHETGQDVQGVVHPFDDRVVLRAAIEAAA